jgi:hypothetical protein
LTCTETLHGYVHGDRTFPGEWAHMRLAAVPTEPSGSGACTWGAARVTCNHASGRCHTWSIRKSGHGRGHVLPGPRALVGRPRPHSLLGRRTARRREESRAPSHPAAAREITQARSAAPPEIFREAAVLALVRGKGYEMVPEGTKALDPGRPTSNILVPCSERASALPAGPRIRLDMNGNLTRLCSWLTETPSANSNTCCSLP